MIAQFYKSEDQKELYFQISAAFKMQNPSTDAKLAGVYAIYNSDTCLYVGQSQNIASRLATHLSGKFSECTHIDVYLIDADEEGYENFYERSANARKNILEYNEQCFIRLLSPIENINANHTIKPDSQRTMRSLFEALETDGEKIKSHIKISNVNYGELVVYFADPVEEPHNLSELLVTDVNSLEHTIASYIESVIYPKGYDLYDVRNKLIPMFESESYALLCVIKGEQNVD